MHKPYTGPDRMMETHREIMHDPEHKTRMMDHMQDPPVMVQSNKAKMWSEK